MHSLRAATVLLLVLAACAPSAWAGTADDPDLQDPAGDQAIDGPYSSAGVPTLPVVNPDTFDDIDLVSAWFQQGRSDCVGAAPMTCPSVVLTVTTSAAWSGGTLNATFQLQKGPTSYANSTAAGQTFSVLVQGTSVSGIPNATAAVTPAGLEVRIPLPRLGAVGGDQLTGLALATTRTNVGLVTDPSATQDDSTGTDEASGGRAYTLLRPTPRAALDLSIAQTGGKAGNAATLTERTTVDVALRAYNVGTDPDQVTLTIASDPPLKKAPAAPAAIDLPQGDVRTVTVPVSLEGMAEGTIRVTFTATSRNGATDDAVAVLVLDLPDAPREVKPAGLDFLSPAAESMGLDGAFGSYAELALLSLIVLAVILAVFLLVALAPSRLVGTSAAEAPPLPEGAAGSGDQAPAALAPTRAPSPVPAPARPPAAAPPVPPADPAAATVAGALKIESVTHAPEAPEEGAPVTTEVVLRNPGPTRQVRVVLSRDGADVDEKPVTLPARATKTVRLSWAAGAGENRVKVRVLPA